MKEVWTLSQLRRALNDDLKSCTSDLERGCCRAFGFREIREKALEFAKTRKLTPGERAILEEAGG